MFQLLVRTHTIFVILSLAPLSTIMYFYYVGVSPYEWWRLGTCEVVSRETQKNSLLNEDLYVVKWAVDGRTSHGTTKFPSLSRAERDEIDSVYRVGTFHTCVWSEADEKDAESLLNDVVRIEDAAVIALVGAFGIVLTFIILFRLILGGELPALFRAWRQGLSEGSSNVVDLPSIPILRRVVREIFTLMVVLVISVLFSYGAPLLGAYLSRNWENRQCTIDAKTCDEKAAACRVVYSFEVESRQFVSTAFNPFFAWVQRSDVDAYETIQQLSVGHRVPCKVQPHPIVLSKLRTQ